MPIDTDFTLRVAQQRPVPLAAELACRGGELLALVGPSGSGKSTLLRLIAGLARAQSGRIQCGSTCWSDSERGIHLPPQDRNVGFVPQHFGLFPHLSAQANVEAGLGHLDPAQRKARALTWLGKVNLAPLADRRPSALSGGEQQRVAVARALAREPSILLLDEPFAAVDRPTRERLYLELAQLKQELAIPIVMVTHDLSEALLLADRITLIDQGRTLQSGTPAEVMARPDSEAAARLIGIPNVFDGEVIRCEDEAGICWIRVDQLDIAIASPPRPLGSRLRWIVPNSAVRLPGIRNQIVPPSRNRCRITFHRIVALGEQARVVAALEGTRHLLELQIPFRLIKALGLEPGSSVEVAMREESLHVLRNDTDRG